MHKDATKLQTVTLAVKRLRKREATSKCSENLKCSRTKHTYELSTKTCHTVTRSRPNHCAFPNIQQQQKLQHISNDFKVKFFCISIEADLNELGGMVSLTA